MEVEIKNPPEQTPNKTEYSNKDLLRIKLTGKSYREMETLTGIPFETIYARISRVLELCDKKKSEAWKENRIQVLNNLEEELLFDIADKSKREKASLNNSAYAFQQVFNARRLEEEKSTVISSYIDICNQEKAINDEIKKLQARLGLYAPDTDNPEDIESINQSDSQLTDQGDAQ